MTKIVASGKTIEDAVRNGLTELQVSAERVHVTVIGQPQEGCLASSVVKEAKVELELLPEPAALLETRSIKSILL